MNTALRISRTCKSIGATIFAVCAAYEWFHGRDGFQYFVCGGLISLSCQLDHIEDLER